MDEFNKYIIAASVDNMDQVMDVILSWLDISDFAPSINGQWLAGRNIRDPTIRSGSESRDEYLASLMPYWGDINGDGTVT